MAEQVKVAGTDFEHALDNGEFPETLMEKVEAILERMKADPGGANEEISLVISNDFEPEEETDDESGYKSETTETPKE